MKIMIAGVVCPFWYNRKAKGAAINVIMAPTITGIRKKMK